jgi:hypothetical protein
MAIRMDSRLVTELENDPLILKLTESLYKDNRIFKKAWVIEGCHTAYAATRNMAWRQGG